MEDIFTCPDDQSGRADKLLAQKYSGFSRSFIKQCIEEGKIVRVDGTLIEPNRKLLPRDQLRVSLVRPNIEDLEPYEHNLSVLYEDEHILIIDKEAGMVVHPGDGTDQKTLVHALLHHCSDSLSPIGAPLRPGIVHRLDKETSGVMVIAKSENAHLSLVDQFSHRSTKKVYHAIVSGRLTGEGEFNQPIGRHPTVRIKMAVSSNGKPAITRWKSLKVFDSHFSYMKAEILTGRTHQIRVHFSSNGHVLAGDKTYGYKANTKKKTDFFPRVMLHASKLEFEHPIKKERVNFCAPIPKDFQNCLKLLSAAGI